MSENIIIYHTANTRGNMVLWALEEFQLPYNVKWLDMEKGEHKTPDYLKIHPFGKVPAASINGTIVSEASAILLSIEDLVGTPFTPINGQKIPAFQSEKLQFNRWLIFRDSVFSNALLEAIGSIQALNRGAFGGGNLPEVLEYLESHLKNHEFLLGKNFSIADISLASGLGWGKFMKVIPDHFKIIHEYITKCTSRPACKRMAEVNAQKSHGLI